MKQHTFIPTPWRPISELPEDAVIIRVGTLTDIIGLNPPRAAWYLRHLGLPDESICYIHWVEGDKSDA